MEIICLTGDFISINTGHTDLNQKTTNACKQLSRQHISTKAVGLQETQSRWCGGSKKTKNYGVTNGYCSAIIINNGSHQRAEHQNSRQWATQAPKDKKRKQQCIKLSLRVLSQIYKCLFGKFCILQIYTYKDYRYVWYLVVWFTYFTRN